MKSAMILETLFDVEEEVPFITPYVWSWDPRKWSWKETFRTEWRRFLKISLLMIVWIIFAILLIITPPKTGATQMEFVPVNGTRSVWVSDNLTRNQVSITIHGSFLPPFSETDAETRWLTVYLELVTIKSERFEEVKANTSQLAPEDITASQVLGEEWKVSIVPEDPDVIYSDHPPHQTHTNMMDFTSDNVLPLPASSLIRFQLSTDSPTPLGLLLKYDIQPIDGDSSIVYAALVLLGLYVMIVFDIVHHTLAAMMASTMSIAVLAAIGQRPSMETIISWIDVETLLLLFSMMVLVAMLTKTGVFDYLAVIAYKMSRGRVWPLIFVMCTFTALLTAIIDSVTTVLLMTPVVIRLCEVLKVNPVPMLMAMIMFSNIGGTMTPIGNPPNVIIASHPDVVNSGVDFATFFVHMGLGVVLVAIVTMLLLRFVFFRNKAAFQFEESETEDLRHELAIWRRTYSAISHFTGDEAALRHGLQKHVAELEHELSSRRESMMSSVYLATRGASVVAPRSIDTNKEEFKKILAELKAKHPIKDPELLLKSGFAMVFAVVFFFIHSVLEVHLSLGWTALIAALLLLALAERQDMDSVLSHVEWTTLLFFAALFVLMEALTHLGLIAWIGHQVEVLVMKADKRYQLTCAMMLIMWVSALASAFIDNIPLATMMVKIVTAMANNPDLDLPQQPLVWALAFGACLGGNGTVIGSSANVVSLGMAEQHGYKITFLQFSKIGLPVMLCSVVTSSIYLLLCHSVGSWHPA